MIADYVVYNDPGGYFVEYLLKGKQLEKQGRRIVIKGYCASACTVYLAFSKTCVKSSAILVFHASTHPTATGLILGMYPKKLKDYIVHHGGLTKRLITIKGKLLKSLVNMC